MAGKSGRQASRVAVLMGGLSAEREVSLSSGRECAQALREAGFTVIEVDAGRDIAARLAEIKPDVCFNALHGRWGEDGCVQGMLEWLAIPYTHSGVLASALSMDKTRAKDIYRGVGLPVVESLLAPKAEVMARHVMAPPYVVKPNAEGSSVGVYIVAKDANSPPHLGEEMPEIAMVEEYVPGRELTVSVLGDRALGVTEIHTSGWYDYHAKYAPGGSTHSCPAIIPAEIAKAACDYALRAHRALGCRGLSRSDFRWDDSRGLAGLFILETNTQPGMTPTSLSPEQAAAVGMSFPELCAWIVEDASCGR
ncbi:D-alanine--D-alanine ligase [Defluviimonas sp. WL0050]|uniref:D-alanine--D-alanine ligase n=1 Tax=Albidovulum litorale TaxID=2984134 RepID=A0ABT2ZK43_9RHOB|nr:D-alanine--D-alanine ligase [Defluviimonas sp. WL0050]MCV2871413.1 D-alanine--D-alanine ligase [Defluviimonas sp. WL0050]